MARYITVIIMSLPYSKPPPYERPNWNRMNAGQQRIFEGQLGAAAGDPDNPVGNWFHEQIYGNVAQKQDTKKVIEEEVSRGALLPRDKIKPDSLNWNKETRAQYPEHWKLERKSREQKKSVERFTYYCKKCNI